MPQSWQTLSCIGEFDQHVTFQCPLDVDGVDMGYAILIPRVSRQPVTHANYERCGILQQQLAIQQYLFVYTLLHGLWCLSVVFVFAKFASWTWVF